MTVRRILWMVTLLLLAAAQAWAVPEGKTLEYAGGGRGKVIFNGTVHYKAGKMCKDCHKEGVFPQMKVKAVPVNMENIKAGRQCGACHNGNDAFGPAECDRCHGRQ